MKVSGSGGGGGTSTTSSPRPTESSGLASLGLGAGATFGGGEGTVTTEYLLNSKSSFKKATLSGATSVSYTHLTLPTKLEV